MFSTKDNVQNGMRATCRERISASAGKCWGETNCKWKEQYNKMVQFYISDSVALPRPRLVGEVGDLLSSVCLLAFLAAAAAFTTVSQSK